MSSYSSLKATINANVKTNGTQAITGSVLNSVLNAMVDSIGADYQYVGVATPSTNPGTPDQKVFYIATTPGTYTNFGGIVVASGECAVLKGTGSTWSKEDTGIDLVSVSQNTPTGTNHTRISVGGNNYDVASVEDVSQLGQDLADIPHPFFAHNYPFITEIYINSKGVTADVYNIHSIGYTNKIVRFSTSQGAWAGETKAIPHIDNIVAITPRGASDLSVIYGYVIVDWSQISADVDIIEPINEAAQVLDYSPTIKSYINKGISVAKMSLSDIPDNAIIKVLDINGGGNYTDFAVAMDDLIANENTQPLSQVLLYIKKGTYIVTPNTTQRASGPIVGCSIIAEEGAEIVCNYDGADSSKVQSFSPINMYAEVSHRIVIDGLRVIVKNCRYCVHDEMGSLLVDNYSHIFRNCSFTHQTAANGVWAYPRCIGGGLGNGGNIVIEDCHFDSKILTSIDYHSGRDGGATGSKIIIQDCFAQNNTFSGTTTQQATANSGSIMVVSNCVLTQTPLQNNYQGRAEVKVLAVGNNIK